MKETFNKIRSLILISLPFLLLLLGLGITYHLWRFTVDETRRDLQNQFDINVQQINSQLVERIKVYSQILYGARSFFANSEIVTRSEFKNFVAELELQKFYPGIEGIGFATIVPLSEKNSHLTLIQSQGFPNYKIYPDSNRNPLTSIVYIEPFTGRNLHSFGYDMYSEPTRRQAMDKAAETNDVVLSGKVQLVQEKNETVKQPGFLIYLPVYKNQASTSSIQPSKKLIGWVYAAFRVGDFMTGMFKNPDEICVELYDGNNISPESILFSFHRTIQVQKPLSYAFFAQHSLEINGHQWTTFIHSQPSFEKNHTQRADFIAIIGIISSLLLTIITALLVSNHHRARVLAYRLTEKLRKNNLKLQYYFTQPFVGMFITDADRNFINVNPCLCEILGYSQQELLNEFKSLKNIIHPDDINISPPYIDKVHRSEIEHYQIEKRYLHKDGHTIYVNVSINTIRNKKGKVEYFIGIVNDISQRKKTEQALIESELKLRTMYNSTTDALMLLDKNRFIDCNQATLKMFGCASIDEFCSKHLADISPPYQSDNSNSLELATQHISQALTQGNHYFEWLHKRLDNGKNFPAEVLLYPITINGKKILQAVVRDISERKQLESEKVQFWNILENSLNEIYIFDIHSFKFIHVNKGARQNLGYSMEELCCLTPLDLKLEFTEQSFKKLIAPLLDKQKEKIIFETVHRRANGSLYPIEVHLQLVARHEQLCFLAIINDITERKQAETALQKSEQKYQSLVNDIGDKFVIFSHNLQGTVLYVSNGIKAFVDIPKEQIIGQNWMETIDWLPGSIETAESYKLHEGTIKFAQFEMRYRRLDGNVRTVQVSEHPVFDENGSVISIDGIIEDITERKLAEQQLKESEERLKLSQEYGEIGCWEADWLNDRQIWSESIYELLGFPKLSNPTWEDFIGCVYPEDRAKVIAANYAHLTEGKKYDVEYRIKIANGEIRWMRSAGKAVFTEDGAPIKFMGIVQDITEQKHMEEELREREAFTTSVINSLTSHIIVLDANGNIITVNQAWKDFVKQHGTEAENDFIGLHYSFCCNCAQNNLYDEQGIKLVQGIQEVLTGNKTSFSSEYICYLSKQQHWFYMQASPLQGSKGGAVISHQDITPLKLAEHALKASEARSRLILELSPVPMVLLEGQNIVFINASFTQTFGYDLNDIPNLETWWQKAYPDPNYRQSILNRWQLPILESEKTKTNSPFLAREEVNICCKDGSQKTVLGNGTLIHEEEKQFLLVSLYDITELKNYELELANNKRITALIEAIPDAIFFKDAQGRFQILNSPAQKLFALQNVPWHGKTDMELVELQPKLKQAYLACIESDNLAWQAGKLTIAYEVICNPDGQLLDFEVRKVPVFDDQGQKQALVVIGRDITEQKRSQEALAASQQSFADLVNSTEGIVWEADPKTFDFTFVSDKAQRLLGYSLQEWLEHDFWISHIHPEDREWAMEYCLTQIAQGKNHDFEYRFIAQEGHIVWLRDIVTPITSNGEIQSLRGLMIDITTYKQMENQLYKLAQTVEQSPESIMMVNKQWEIEYVNETFVQITGYSREEAMGQNPRMLASGKTEKQTFAKLWQALKDGKAWKGEFINRRKNGSEYVEFAVISPVRDKKGDITHYVAVKEDITEKKRLAEELNRHRYHLEELVKQRTIELEAAKVQAEAANQAKSEFLANMSHEIRTPMNAIIGFSSILNDLVKNPVQKHYLNAIQKSSKTLLQLINDILDLSKIEAGKLDLNYRWVELKSIFEDVRLVFTQKLSEKSLNYILEIPDDMPTYLYLDEIRIRQILLNIIGNAVKFTEKGFIKVSVKIQPSVSTQYVDLKIAISDNGIGIAKDQQEIIFQAFTQQKQQNASYGGTGLGLTICDRLIKMMHGTMSVSSELGQGSCFTIEIPKVEINYEIHRLVEKKQTSQRARVYFKPASLLLVDDKITNRELIRAFLFEYPELNITDAETGEQALELVKQSQFDLILMDRILPGKDGDIICKEIRDMPKYKNIPIIMISASPLSAPKKQNYNLQLNKPLSHIELLVALQSLLPLKSTTSLHEEKINDVTIEYEIDYEKYQKLLKLLISYYQPKIEKLKNLGVIPINIIIEIAEDLNKVAEEFHYPPLYDWSNILKNQAKIFDLVNIIKTLNNFENLLNQIKRQLSK